MSRTSPIQIALAVVFALIFVVGLVITGLGGYGYIHRNEAVLNIQAQIRADDISGQPHGNTQKADEMDIAQTVAKSDQERSLKMLGLGTILMLPLVIFGTLSARTRTS